MNTGLDQYMDIFKDAVEDSAAKLTKSFEKILIEVIILFMVIPRKINFTQMGRYGSHVEQTYRNAFGLKKSKSIDWLKLNVSLAKRFFGKQGRWAIAIDPSYISKAGKKTPHIGRFWSGCAQSVKHGLEMWSDRNMPGKVIDVTPSSATDNMLLNANLDEMNPAHTQWKGVEIASWIADNLQDEGRYVIIDDEYVIQDSQLPHFILTNPYDGITGDLANRAIKILNG